MNLKKKSKNTKMSNLNKKDNQKRLQSRETKRIKNF